MGWRRQSVRFSFFQEGPPPAPAQGIHSQGDVCHGCAAIVEDKLELVSLIGQLGHSCDGGHAAGRQGCQAGQVYTFAVPI
jgi:hypothetical protein